MAQLPEPAVRPNDERHEELTRIHSAHATLVRRILHRYAPADQIDDLVQQVFVKIWFGIENFRGESQLRTWVVRITLNVGHDFLRQKMRRSWLSFFEPSHPTLNSLSTGAQGNAVLLELSARKAVATLTPKLREVLILSSVKDLSEEEMADCLGISRAAVKSRLFEARKKMAKLLNDNDKEEA